jgi:hypothetical protein
MGGAGGSRVICFNEGLSNGGDFIPIKRIEKYTKALWRIIIFPEFEEECIKNETDDKKGDDDGLASKVSERGKDGASTRR